MSVILFTRGVVPYRWDQIPLKGNTGTRQAVTSYSPMNMGPDRKWHHTPWKEHGTRQEVTSYPLKGTWDQTGSDIIPPGRNMGPDREWHHTHPGTRKVDSTHPTGVLSCFWLRLQFLSQLMACMGLNLSVHMMWIWDNDTKSQTLHYFRWINHNRNRTVWTTLRVPHT